MASVDASVPPTWRLRLPAETRLIGTLEPLTCSESILMSEPDSVVEISMEEALVMP